MPESTVVDIPAAAPAPALASRIGTVELGCFRLDAVLGEGWHGTTYLATQLGLRRPAVVKIAHADRLASPHAATMRLRFAEELRTATRVTHPNLVTLYAAGETRDGAPVIAMERAAGQTLEQRLAAHASGLPHDVLGPAFTQLAAALAALHAHGLVHRALSPRSARLELAPDRPAKLKVLDLGLSTLRPQPRHWSARAGERYVAPEQLAGRATPASDVYAMGAMLWWALTGREYDPPGECGGDDHTDPRRIAPALPARVARFVGRMLARREHERPCAKAVLAAWTDVVEEIIPAPSRTPTRPALRTVHEALTPQAPVSPTPPLASGSVDPEVLEEMRSDDAVLRDIIQMFVGQTPRQLARIEAGYQRGNAKRVDDECRMLCSGARALGANRLARLAQTTSHVVRNRDLEAVPELVAEMEREYDRVFHALIEQHVDTT